MNKEETYRVIAPYQVAYPDPIVVSAGDEIIVGEEDAEYPGWVWCTNAGGKSGWLPLNCIERSGEANEARYDYSAVELSAEVGEELKASRQESGWAWCVNKNNRGGWIPLANLEKIK